MNIYIALIALVAGLVILIKSADLLVDGAAALAARLSIPPLLVGLTIVAMGTSAPELAASIAAVLTGRSGAAVGNVYGSNVANLALVGGITAIFRPILVTKITLKRDLPAMLAVALLLWPVFADMSITRPESILLLIVFFAVMALTIYTGKKRQQSPAVHGVSPEDVIPAVPDTHHSLPVSLLYIILGLVGLAFGARITVDGAVYIGQKAGLSDSVIGLTIIAVGTSLPELMTCVVAALKKQDDISIGNLVGSNVFNTVLVIGTAGVITPFTIGPRLIGTDYWFMIAISVLFFAVALIFKKINRPTGITLAVIYFAYITYLVIFTRTA